MNILIRSYGSSKIRPEVLMSVKRFSRTVHCNRAFNSIHGHGGFYANSSTSSFVNLRYTYYRQLNYGELSNAYNFVRHICVSQTLHEQPSSKVEATVQTMKNKQKEKVEEIMKEAANTASTSATASSSSSIEQGSKDKTFGTGKLPEASSKAVVVKKPLKTRIWEELVHYYHGFRLLIIDINICRKLLWRILNGKTLTRRESKLLVRTTSDLFRLIPFSVFIIVPFMELLLPFFIKFFPGMLPSTFQTAKEREDKLKQSVQIRIEMVKFLQKTLDEMAVQHKEHTSDEAKQFHDFFQKIKNPNEYVSNEEIIKYAKRFEDELTLDSLTREQLIALCRVLELNTVGTTNFLRFQLRLKLRSLAADDLVIAREGVNTLDLWELQQACKARGMRAYGLTEERMRTQLQEWIDLSLNEKVPPTLLLLSRTMLLSEDSMTTDKLKETIRGLPDSVATQTKAAIEEREGKIDNKTKIEIMKEEERKIKEEREEEREEELVKAMAKNEAEKIKQTEVQRDMAEMLLRAKEMDPSLAAAQNETRRVAAAAAEKVKLDEEEKTISSKDMALLNEALKTLSTDKKMVVEKETIKEIKEELEDYKEDVQELTEVGQAVQEPVAESRAAKMLFKKVNRMLGQLDNVLNDLENKHKQKLQQDGCPKLEIDGSHDPQCKQKEELLHIDELVRIVKKMIQTTEESRLKQIVNVLSKLDTDKDGAITVDEVLKVVEAIGRENVKLNEKQLEELIALLDKEQLLEAEVKIQKALDKSQKEAAEMAKQNDTITTNKTSEICSSNKSTQANDKNIQCSDELIDKAKVVKDTTTDMNIKDEKNNLKTDNHNNDRKEKTFLDSTGSEDEKILPKKTVTTSANLTPPPPTPPPPPSSQAIQIGGKDKMI